MNECTSRLCLDIAEAAGFHAQVMGVLAGLSFAVLAVLISQGSTSRPGVYGTMSLLVSMAGCTVASFLYGTAAAEESGAVRAGAMTLTAGVIASVAVCMLLLVVALLSEQRGTGGMPIRRSISIWGPMLASVYVAVSAADLLVARAPTSGNELFVQVSLTVAASVLAVALGILQARAASRAQLIEPASVESAISRVAAIACGIGIVAFLVLLYWSDSASWLGLVPIVVATWGWFAFRFSLEARKLIATQPRSEATPEKPAL